MEVGKTGTGGCANQGVLASSSGNTSNRLLEQQSLGLGVGISVNHISASPDEGEAGMNVG
jgi:hypothetical protein